MGEGDRLTSVLLKGQTVNTDEMIALVDHRTKMYDLQGRIASLFARINPARNLWVSIYPPLSQKSVGMAPMLQSWRHAQRSEIAFLYFHIPFCPRICRYCHFAVSRRKSLMAPYIAALSEEAHAYLSTLDHDNAVRHVYFGGGTPSLLNPALMQRLLATVFQHIRKERVEGVTVEFHANAVQEEFLTELKGSGVNRVSIGVQSFDDTVNRQNGRGATAPETVRSLCSAIRGIGIQEVNIDLMAGLYGQALPSALRDIQHVHPLVADGLIDSVSVYPRSYSSSSRPFPEEHVSEGSILERMRIQLMHMVYFGEILGWRESPMFYFARPRLDERQPSSCAASVNVVSKLGFGNSAYSYFDTTNYRNLFSVAAYIDAISNKRSVTESSHTLGRKEVKKRRLVFAVKRGYIDLKADLDPEDRESPEVVSQNARMVADGFAEANGSFLRLTPLGRLFVQYVLSSYEQLFGSSLLH